MVMIPSDVGVRMRMQTDPLPLQPTAPVTEIPSDLPELRPGQTFTARIQEVLPEATYKALVAGKQLTLQLPEGAKPGDTLELVVIDRTPKVVIAQLAANAEGAAAAGQAYKHTTFSPAAQMLAQLLLPEGSAPQPAPLNGGRPLLAQAPEAAAATSTADGKPATPGATLAAALQQSVTESGLFYEAHQAQWIAGRLPTAQLLLEPQGRQSAPALLAEHGLPSAPTRGEAAESKTSSSGVSLASLLQTLFGGAQKTDETVTQAAVAPTGNASATVPEELRPLVQQQLDTAGTQRMVWHGEVWPQQEMDWEIEWEQPKGDNPSSEDDQAAWRTSVRLSTPRLGQVDASLQLTAAGVKMTLATPYGASAADLRDESPALATALAAAGVPLVAFVVKHEPE